MVTDLSASVCMLVKEGVIDFWPGRDNNAMTLFRTIARRMHGTAATCVYEWLMVSEYES